MTITTRLLLFFLTALATVLAGFSGTLYTLAHTHLFAQFDRHVTATLDTLVALAEIEPDGLDWEPELRRLPAQWEGDPPVWAVYDQDGARIDGSHAPSHQLADFAAPGGDAGQEHFQVRWGGGDWRVARQTLRYPDARAVHSRPGRKRYRTLVFVIAVPLAPTHDSLGALAWCLGGVSVAAWAAAACMGRWVCRRALAPLTRMSGAAKRIGPDDLGARLPVPASRDELADLAAAFNGLLGRLQDSFERQRRFTGEASHQLRTPLTAMLGQLEVALRRDRDPDEYRRALTSAVAQAGRLRQIVEALLFLARADADAQLPGLEAMDLAAWLTRHIAEAWSGHPRCGDVRVERQGDVSLPVVAQPTLLGQAVDNLIDNALKYSAPGSPVRVRVAPVADGAEIAVEDEGVGIAATDLGRVFEPFFRAEDARRRGVAGLGLGLAVAERIVRGFGGRIEGHGLPGRGSRFTVTLPLNPGRAPTDTATPSVSVGECGT